MVVRKAMKRYIFLVVKAPTNVSSAVKGSIGRASILVMHLHVPRNLPEFGLGRGRWGKVVGQEGLGGIGPWSPETRRAFRISSTPHDSSSEWYIGLF